MRLFVLARHGESTLNVERVGNGDAARDVRLTERGRAESRLLGAQVRNVPLDVCVHSRFGRTRETAEIALEQRGVRFEVEPLLDDIDVGDLEAESLDDYRVWKRTHARDDPFPNVESLDATARRYALNAAEASADPESPHSRIANATPYCFGEDLLAAAAERLANGRRGRR